MLRVSSNGLDLIKPDDPKPCGAIRVDFTAGHAVFRRKQQDLIGVRPLLFRVGEFKQVFPTASVLFFDG